jgi:hypothetical protein
VDHGPEQWTYWICRRQCSVVCGRQYPSVRDVRCVGSAHIGNPGHDGGTVCLPSHTSTALVCNDLTFEWWCSKQTTEKKREGTCG